MRAVRKPPAPVPFSSACSPTFSPSLQYRGRLFESSASRPGLSVTTALELVSECHRCETSPGRPRDDAATAASPATGTSATHTSSTVPIRRRVRLGKRGTIQRERRGKAGRGHRRQHHQHHDPEHVPVVRSRGQGDVVVGERMVSESPRGPEPPLRPLRDRAPGRRAAASASTRTTRRRRRSLRSARRASRRARARRARSTAPGCSAP